MVGCVHTQELRGLGPLRPPSNPKIGSRIRVSKSRAYRHWRIRRAVKRLER